MFDEKISRRTMLKRLAWGLAALYLVPGAVLGNIGKNEKSNPLITKTIPSTGEQIPVIGMGTWRTFNVGKDQKLRRERVQVLAEFFKAGGRVIDCSPMYGSSMDVVGYGLEKLDRQDRVFSADKVWTYNGKRTGQQVNNSRQRWRIGSFNLMQVHNLVAWEEHLPTLFEMKEAGELDYVGITTSHGRRHDTFEKIMKSEPLDFVQLTYNIIDRAPEKRLLPLAREEKIAVLANRPYRGGSLIRNLKNNNQPLPDWAPAFDCTNWAEFLLKYIVSHPTVTATIPATTRVDHMRENMGASRGRLPYPDERKRMAGYVRNL